MNEILGMQEPDAINMDQPLGRERSFEEIRAKISENIDVLYEAVRNRDMETIEALGAEIELYRKEREALEQEVEKLGHCPEGISAGVLLARSFFEADMNILTGHMAILDEYLKAYADAQRSGTFRGMFMRESSENRAEPFFRGVTLKTYERWVVQNTIILNNERSPDAIDLFYKKIHDYQNDIAAFDVSIRSIQSKLYNPEIKAVRPLLENDIERLHLIQMAIQGYLDAYRKVVTKHQEEALTVQ